MPEDDASLGQIVGRHFHLHFISSGDPDEVLPHFAADVRKDFVSVLKFHTVHGGGQNLINGSVDLNKILVFLSWHKNRF
jgi:hypothetical protein